MSSPPDRPLVLLVEDSEDDAFFFRWTLKKCEMVCDLVHESDGGGAIRHLERALAAGGRRPDLIFLDLKIPTFSGFEVLSWIRERDITPPLFIAVLSGSENANDIQRATALGASAYYVKPLAADQLRARFKTWQENQTVIPPPGTRAPDSSMSSITSA